MAVDQSRRHAALGIAGWSSRVAGFPPGRGTRNLALSPASRSTTGRLLMTAKNNYNVFLYSA